MGRRKYKGPIFGPFFFNINKPVGVTSFDVIRKLQRNLPRAIGKIGHFGTLDPFADGVLLIGIGPATRLNNWTQTLPKEYIATGVFGVQSETGDNTAEEGQYKKDECFDISTLSFDDVEKSLQSFLGEYNQVPHKYSATKHQGKSLHEWAREGVEIKKDPVLRTIYDIELISLEGDKCKFRVRVSSGTYIRVLFEDLSKKLGTLGHLTDLTRTAIGDHCIEKSADQECWPTDFENSSDFLEEYSSSINNIVKYEELDLDESSAKRFSNGVKLNIDKPDSFYWVTNGELILGLGESKNGELSASVNFVPPALRKIDLTTRNSLDEES